MHEVNVLDQLLPEPGAFYIMDRGFLDFERLYRYHEAGSFRLPVWIAISVYVIVAIVKKRMKLPASLYEVLLVSKPALN